MAILIFVVTTSCHSYKARKNSAQYYVSTYENKKLANRVLVLNGYNQYKSFYNYDSEGNQISITRNSQKDDSTKSLILLISRGFYDSGNKKFMKMQYESGLIVTCYYTKYSPENKVLESINYGQLDSKKFIQIERFIYDSLGFLVHEHRIDSNKILDAYYQYNDKGDISTIKYTTSDSSDSVQNSFYTNSLRIDSFKYNYNKQGSMKRKYVIVNGIDSLIEIRKYRKRCLTMGIKKYGSQ